MQRTERSTNPFSLQVLPKTQAARTARTNQAPESESKEDFLKFQGLLSQEKQSASQHKVQSEKHSLSGGSPLPFFGGEKAKEKERDSTLSDITQIFKNNSNKVTQSRGCKSSYGSLAWAETQSFRQGSSAYQVPNSTKTKSAKTSSFKHKKNPSRSKASPINGSAATLKSQQNLKKEEGRGGAGSGKQAASVNKIQEYVSQDDQVMEETLQKLIKNKNISIKKDEIYKARIVFYPELEKTQSCSDRCDVEVLDKKALENLYLKKLLLKNQHSQIITENEDDCSNKERSGSKKAKLNITPRIGSSSQSNKENKSSTLSKSGRLKQTVFHRIDLNNGKDNPSGKESKLGKKKGDSQRDSAKSKNYNLSQMRSPNQGQLLTKEAIIYAQQFQRLQSAKEDSQGRKQDSRARAGIGMFNYQPTNSLSYQKMISKQILMKTKGIKMRNASPKTDKPTKTVSKIAEVVKEHTYNEAHKESLEMGRNQSVPQKSVTEKKEVSRQGTPMQMSHGRQKSTEKKKEFSLVDKLKTCELLKDDQENCVNLHNSPSRYSKASEISNSTAGAPEIGEEMQSNHVNETKTIKEKMGRDYNSTQDQEEIKRLSEKLSEEERQRESAKKMVVSKWSRKLTSQDMQPIIQQEKLFFEITKFVMYKQELTVNFPQMAQTTKKAFEFMKKLLQRQEDKLIQMYLQICKVDLLVQFLIQEMKNELTKEKEGSMIMHQMKTVIVHTHKSILSYLEIATSLIGGSSITSSLSRILPQVRQNLDLALSYLGNICRDRESDKMFEELQTIIKRVEIVKASSQSLWVFEQILLRLEPSERTVHKTPHSADRNGKRGKGRTEPPINNSEQKARRNYLGPISQLLSREGICQKVPDGDSVQCVKYSKHHSSMSPVRSKRAYILPPKRDCFEYTLVLDLDETLVHYEASERKFKLRPNCVAFLRQVSSMFEVVIFTAASQDYADFILDALDPQRQWIQHRLYRQHTEYDDGVYVKDLSKLGRDLSKTVIIDNIRDNFERQDDNGIEIKTWTSDPADRELDVMLRFLSRLVEQKVRDVRLLVKDFNDHYPSPKKVSLVENQPEEELPQKDNNLAFTPMVEKKGPEAKFIR